jgi:hypothetical protein
MTWGPDHELAQHFVYARYGRDVVDGPDFPAPVSRKPRRWKWGDLQAYDESRSASSPS